MTNKAIILQTYPRARLVTDQSRGYFFGVWSGDGYIGISYTTEEEAWEKAVKQIGTMMLRKFEQ